MRFQMKWELQVVSLSPNLSGMASLRNFHKISDEMKIVILNIRSACSHMAFLLSFSLYSLPPATKFGQGYIFTGVCDSVNRGGVCLSACWDTPWSRHPPSRHPPPGADTPRHRACWEIRSTRRRYASYWNAILLMFVLSMMNQTFSQRFVRFTSPRKVKSVFSAA